MPNQEILFRGFHPCEDGNATIFVEGKAVIGRWVEGDLLHWYNTDENKEFTCIIPNEYGADGSINIQDLIVHPSTVGQYTGLQDKNGVRIFAGDKICVKSYKGTIIFTEGYWKIEWQENYHVRTDLYFFCTDKEIDIEVIGTIFDKEVTPVRTGLYFFCTDKEIDIEVTGTIFDKRQPHDSNKNRVVRLHGKPRNRL